MIAGESDGSYQYPHGDFYEVPGTGEIYRNNEVVILDFDTIEKARLSDRKIRPRVVRKF